MLKKISIKVLKILRSKKIFSFPKKNSIIIFDDINSNLIEELILKNKNYTILHNYQIIYLPILLYSIFFLKYPRYAYQIAFLKYTNAKYVINYHDDAIKISIPCKLVGCKLILIQNGLRDQYCFPELKDNKKWEADYYFVQSEDWKNWIKDKIDTKFIVTGSLKNNCFERKNFKKIKQLVWISHFTENKVISAKSKKSRQNISWNEDVYEVNKICLGILKKFCSIKKLSLVVLPKYKNQSFQEKNFYKEFNLNLIENSNTSWRSSYEILDSDSLIVSTNSTLGLELFSRNFKVVFFGLRSVFLNDPSMRFGWPLKTKDTGPFWCNLVNENEMFNTLESVLNMDQENWNKKISDFKSVMMYDYKNKKILDFFSSIKV